MFIRHIFFQFTLSSEIVVQDTWHNNNNILFSFYFLGLLSSPPSFSLIPETNPLLTPVKVQIPQLLYKNTAGRAQSNPAAGESLSSPHFYWLHVCPPPLFSSLTQPCPPLAICWPNNHPISQSLCFLHSPSFISSSVCRQKHSGRRENHNYHSCQAPSGSLPFTLSSKTSLSYCMLLSPHAFSRPNIPSFCPSSLTTAPHTFLKSHTCCFFWLPFLYFCRVPSPTQWKLQWEKWDIKEGKTKMAQVRGARLSLCCWCHSKQTSSHKWSGPHCKVHGLIVLLNHFLALGTLFTWFVKINHILTWLSHCRFQWSTESGIHRQGGGQKSSWLFN